MQNTPQNSSSESVLLASPQSNLSEFIMRLCFAGFIGWASWHVSAPGEGLWVLPWLGSITAIEAFGRFRLMKSRGALQGNDPATVRRVATYLVIYTVFLTALYASPSLILADNGGLASLFAFLVACGICMNVASQHILTRWLILLTLPLPGAAVIIGAVHVAGGESPVIAGFLAGSMLLQALSYNAVSRNFFTKLTQARQQADAANRAKSGFLANMSHELRTPLNAIVGYAQLMREDAELENRAADKEDLDRIMSASRRLQHLINDLLDLSKIDSDAAQLEIAPFDIAARLKDVVDTVKPTAAANNTTIELDVQPVIGLAQNDAFRFDQCVLNLLSNAAKFTQDGKITVRARRGLDACGDHVLTIDVADTGIGISEDQQSRIFRPFEQADASTTRKYGGTGLGLALTQKLARWMGGDLTVKSALGKGACFVLTIRADLPATVAEDRDTDASAPEVTSAAA